MTRHALLLMTALLVLPGLASAGPDDFICDTAIYGGETALVKPNVLIVFDTSGSMGDNISTQVCVPNPDYDFDGILDVNDNCPYVANARQEDCNGNGVGDACDTVVCPPALDTDGDGDPDSEDNCPTIWNPWQQDSNGNGIGNACEIDTDGDGVPDSEDNCPTISNPWQQDSNGNGIGDACEIVSGDYTPGTNYTSGVTTEYCGRKDHHGDYDDLCVRDAVYLCTARDWNGGNCDDWDKVENRVSDISCSGTTIDDTAKTALNNEGRYTTSRYKIESNCGLTDKTRYYATGNWIVWYNMTGGGVTFNRLPPPSDSYVAGISVGPPDLPAAATSATSGATICTTVQEQKVSIARNVIEDLIRTTEGVNFGVMQFNNGTGTQAAAQGAKFITRNVGGSNYISTIKDMSAIHTGTTTNEDALVNVVQNLSQNGYTPLAESLYEAMRYFKGETSAFSAWTGNYPSPITASCQQTYVIFMTDGMATGDNSAVLNTLCGDGDCDNDNNRNDGAQSDGESDSLDDIAYYLKNTDLSTTYAGTQNVLTFTIGFGLGGANATAVQLLEDTAENGGGQAYLAENYQALTGALTSIIGQILEVNSAFVAPVVPTNPENKTYSGKRVYLGFFKPITNNDWKGNLKKFGLGYSGAVVDKNNVVATDANGRFLATATSYWSVAADGSNVDEGGVGDLLATRNFTTDPRLIYTYTGSNADLTDASNQVADGNLALTSAMLGVGATERTALINYIHGFDSYDADLDANTTERRDWILGDILHSRPAIQAYSRYALDDESDITQNSSIIFIGSNDGQIHAFRDADGKELWSFIPPAALPSLRFLGDNIHNYYMDGSPRIFSYDYDGDGNIGPGPESVEGDTDPRGADDGSQDMVLMIIGMRRGGGIDTLSPTESRGSYFAIDLTDPLNPHYLWELKSTTTGFGELGETWSTPQFGQVRVATTADPVMRDRLVAVIGAGYDTNEDLRFGNTVTFPGCADQSTAASRASCDATESTLRADDVTLDYSPGTLSQWNPKGRGVYFLELATIDGNGVPSFHSTPVKLWEWTYSSTRAASADSANNPTHSFPTEVVTLDRNYDGLIDYLYAGDTGGNMWRFTISDQQSTANWFAKKIFSANPATCIPATGDCGRKIMEPPSVVFEPGYTGLYFGTGDRAHPLNKGGLDRLYTVYDRGQTTAKSESDLVDVTSDILQSATPPTFSGTCNDSDNSISCLLTRLSSPSKYGWFIKLDQDDGEKVLAPPVVFNKVAYYTTYTPNVVTSDPCLSGNLGLGRTYAVNYKTGEAVFNFDTTNDSETNFNERATVEGATGVLLRRSDRRMIMGSGIPSGVVVFIREDGTVGALAGCGGGLCASPVSPGGTAFPIYWMQE